MSTRTTICFLLFSSFFVLVINSQNKQINQSLFFKHDSFNLTQEHLEKIESLKSQFLKDSVSINIKGYTNNYGTKKYNLKLSKQRVTSVSNVFGDNFNVTSKAFGELENASSKSRRVDIEITVYNRRKPKTINPEIKLEPKEKEKVSVKKDILNTNQDIKIGETYTLQGILFKGAEDVFLDESFPELKKLLGFMKSNNYKIKLLGHICCTTNGKDGFNKNTRKNTLSVDRAKAVYNYLIENGIDKNRMSYVGLAGNFPTGKASKYDRRVEIEILSLD